MFPQSAQTAGRRTYSSSPHGSAGLRIFPPLFLYLLPRGPLDNRLCTSRKIAPVLTVILQPPLIFVGLGVGLEVEHVPAVFLKRQDANVIISIVIQLVRDKMPRYVQASPYDIQVLTPMRKGLLGVERLNKILQEYLNPPDAGKKEHEQNGMLFREGDKVMQIKNNYRD